jgi:DNA processing protein
MSGEKLKYQIALTLISGIGDVLAKNLVSYCGGAQEIFNSKKNSLLKIPGIDDKRATAIAAFEDWKLVESELLFIEKNNIQTFFYLDQNYPTRLKGLSDAPVLLFSKGKMNLNEDRMIAIVGTRHATDYGKLLIEEMVAGLKTYNAVIVSGLAYGIDIAAHRSAVKNEMQTIGVLAHGLDKLYPGQHRSTAEKMEHNGGLLTEFKSCDSFEPPNFVRRNRIVAGLCDATIVIESAINGGALITAEIANSYNRDVFCIPGKVGDKFSEGTNFFIKSNKATLVEHAADVVQQLGWNDSKAGASVQKKLFIELDEQETLIVDLLKENESVHVDVISSFTKLPLSKLAATLLGMEFKGVLISLPGKMYKLS